MSIYHVLKWVISNVAGLAGKVKRGKIEDFEIFHRENMGKSRKCI